MHAVPRYWRDALLSGEAGPITLAVTAGPMQAANNWFTYFFFGRRFQNRLIYVPPTRSGRVVHFGPNQTLQSVGDQQAWTQRLHAQGVHAVLSFLPRSVESVWMDQSPEQFKKLAGDEEWGLYAVVRDRSIAR